MSITLILLDNQDKIIISDLDKSILKTSCEYFDRLFTNFKEEFEKEIIINVPNKSALVMCDIIMSFYGQTIDIGKLAHLDYSTAFIKCHDFFGLVLDKKYLDYLVINDENFDELLNILRLNNYDLPIAKYVIDNMPDNYDITKMDKLLVKEISKMNNNNIMIFGSNIKIIDPHNGQIISTWDRIKTIFNALSFSPYNNLVAVGNNNGHIILFDATNGSVIKTLYGHSKGIRDVSFSLDGTKIVSADTSGKINIWDTFSGNLIKSMHGGGNIRHIIFSSDGEKIIFSNGHGGIEIWNAVTGHSWCRMNEKNKIISALSCSPTSNQVASISSDHKILILDPIIASFNKILSGHTDIVTCIMYSSDGKRIISGSKDSTIKIWSAENYQLINTLSGHDSGIVSVSISVSFLPKNKNLTNGLIISATIDIIKIWDYETGVLINTVVVTDNNIRNAFLIPDYDFDNKFKKY